MSILIALSAIYAIGPLLLAPDAARKSKAAKRAGYKPSASAGGWALLFIFLALPLWWWYALTEGPWLIAAPMTLAALIQWGVTAGTLADGGDA